MRIKKYIYSAAIISLTVMGLLLTGCSGQDEVKSESMEDIQKAEGTPVVIQTVQLRAFEKDLTFFGQFKGYKETIIGAMIGGRIETIHAKPGDRVKENQVIIEFPKDSPASQYQQAKAAFENSQKTYERMKALHEKGEIAQAQFDGITTKYLVDKRNYETMSDMLHLDAPYNGVVTELMVHEGDNVKAKAPLFTVAQLNKMKLRIWLSDEERMEIKKGMSVEAKVGQKIFPGKLYDLSMSVDPMKQAFYADIIFDNSNGEILPGLTAEVKVILYQNPKAIAITRNLVKTAADGQSFVFLAKGNKAVRQPVHIAHESGVLYEIDNGLQAGDPLITRGNARLTDGVKIKVVK